MKPVFVLPVLGFALLIGTATGLAQQSQKINYRATAFIKIAPEKEAPMQAFLKTTGMKLIQEEINSGRFASWTMLRITYAGVPAADYNYLQAVEYDGAPPDPLSPAARDAMFRKATGLSFQEYQEKLMSVGMVDGSVLSRIEADAPGSKIAEGNYIQTIRWKITPERGADYGSYMQKMMLPLNVQAMKDGRILGWSAARTVFPGGADAAYDATTSFTFKDLAAALPTTAPSPDAAQMGFGKVFPGQNYTAFVDQGRAIRRVVRTDLWRVVAVSGSPTTIRTSSR
jgi:hypothetical protein